MWKLSPMHDRDVYIDRKGNEFLLAELDQQQQDLVNELLQFAETNDCTWTDFEKFWIPKVDQFYKARGLSRKKITQTIIWRIAQDLSSRLGLKEGWMKEGDYRDELNLLISKKYRTRREFCEATGLSEDLLSHVLAKRKNLSVESLTEALNNIGYTIRIAPLPNAEA